MSETIDDATLSGDTTDNGGDNVDASPDNTGQSEIRDPENPDDSVETFPREVVEKLRQENGKYRQRAQQADGLAQRLHVELVRATGRLADPTDLPFDAEHLEGSDKLSLALDELLERKPHLATRKPAGDIGQGQRGTAPESFSLLGLLKERT